MLHLVERSKLVAEGLKIRRANLDGNCSGLVATFILVRLSIFVDSITEYTQRLQEAGYKDYSRTIDEKPSGTPGEVPYVISPDEFGELEDYTKVSLTYFADGVLADECGEIVDDVEEIIGDGLDHFGEYEDDSVFVRSDAKRCDYEILKDLRDFSDFKKKNFPPNNDEEV